MCKFHPTGFERVDADFAYATSERSLKTGVSRVEYKEKNIVLSDSYIRLKGRAWTRANRR
jgi:hypothetical protein